MSKFLALIQSRKFIVALVTFAVVVVQHYIPNFAISESDLVGFVIVAIGLIVSVAVAPVVPGINKWVDLLNKREFWLSLVGGGFLIINGLGQTPIFSQEQVVSMALLLSGYIASVSLKRRSVVDTETFKSLLETMMKK